jgi:hypothetical protein
MGPQMPNNIWRMCESINQLEYETVEDCYHQSSIEDQPGACNTRNREGGYQVGRKAKSLISTIVKDRQHGPQREKVISPIPQVSRLA